MDPLSASSYNLSAQRDTRLDSTASTKSLSHYEQRNLKNLSPQVTVIATSNHIVVGIALAYSAVLIPQLENSDDIPVTKTQTSWIASVLALVAPFGSILSGYLMDKWGRITVLKLSVVPGLLGWVLIATSRSVPMIIIGRVFSGLASTLSTSPAVVYITEIARKDMRGSLIALGPSYVSLGMVIAYFKGWLISWRLIAWLCNIYLVVPFFLLFLIPESPIWLVSKGRVQEAQKALDWLHKYQPRPNNQKSFAEMTLNLLVKEDETKKSEAQGGDSTIREFLKPTGYKPLLILSGLFFFQQYSGIYIFLFYSVSFFENVGTNVNPYIASILIGVIRLIMSLLNTWMLKRFSRRVLIMISGSGMALAMLISGLFTSWIKEGTTDLTWVPVVFLLFYVVASMVGLLTIPWTMTAELFPLKIRSMAHSISTSIVNLIMFFAVQNYVSMEVALGGSAGVQWFFAGLSLGAVLFTFVFLPETHRKKLSEIEDYFKHNTIYLGQKTKETPVSDKNEIDNLIKHV
ncbi:Facilitated trehalose transporter Tret1-2 homolog-like Protein [Tribolium castaneum]|uniref:Facilitated trehalose transporter Tret1-2 homolog-like Protein n=1 Tax=Tribolium castaneum TaxID=7070 RepID=D2A496_TRICA|nr:Facilitated trehalose transporter Tret1-2 homolog-like Protein [Tribolium castaneum]